MTLRAVVAWANSRRAKWIGVVTTAENTHGRQNAYSRKPLAARLKSTIPIPIATGPHDVIFAPEMMRLLDAELPTSRLEIPDAGHSPYFERPYAWNHAVLEDLGG